MVTTFFGILTALVIIILTVLLSKQIPAKLIAATTLCAIAFIYVGFSLQGNAINLSIVEVIAAIAFYFVVVIGYVKNNSLIAYGIILHGIWDILHHHASVIQTGVPIYWPPYCLVVDLLVGFYFMLYFKLIKNNNAFVKAIVNRL